MTQEDQKQYKTTKVIDSLRALNIRIGVIHEQMKDGAYSLESALSDPEGTMKRVRRVQAAILGLLTGAIGEMLKIQTLASEIQARYFGNALPGRFPKAPDNTVKQALKSFENIDPMDSAALNKYLHTALADSKIHDGIYSALLAMNLGYDSISIALDNFLSSEPADGKDINALNNATIDMILKMPKILEAVTNLVDFSETFLELASLKKTHERGTVLPFFRCDTCPDTPPGFPYQRADSLRWLHPNLSKPLLVCKVCHNNLKADPDAFRWSGPVPKWADLDKFSPETHSSLRPKPKE